MCDAPKVASNWPQKRPEGYEGSDQYITEHRTITPLPNCESTAKNKTNNSFPYLGASLRDNESTRN